MISATLVGIRTVRIGNFFRGDGVTLPVLEDLIRGRQTVIAEMFGNERTAKGPLKFNDPRYTASKSDKRRGHKDGHLQRSLDRNILWTVRYTPPSGDKPGVAFLSFSEQKLIERVPHYKYYRDGSTRWKRHPKGKTPGGAGVLIMTKAFAAEVKKKLNREADERAAGRVGKRRLKEQADRAQTKRIRA